MIDVKSTQDVPAAIHELVHVWNRSGRADLARRFNVLVSPSACWTTGSEFLTELDSLIDEVLKENGTSIGPPEKSQLLAIKQVISDWFEYAAKHARREPPDSVGD